MSLIYFPYTLDVIHKKSPKNTNANAMHINIYICSKYMKTYVGSRYKVEMWTQINPTKLGLFLYAKNLRKICLIMKLIRNMKKE